MRDAIHIATMSVIPDYEYPTPGEKVKLIFGSKTHVKPADYGDHIGVLDPFMPYNPGIKRGDKVTLYLNPGSVANITHTWEHPLSDVDVTVGMSEEELWLRTFCDTWNMDYDSTIAEALLGKEGYAITRGIQTNNGEDFSGEKGRFWECLSKIKGITFTKAHQRSFTWGCSC